MCTIKIEDRRTFAPGGSLAFNMDTRQWIYSPEDLHRQLAQCAEVRFVSIWPSCKDRRKR